jgi:hypothetical protein
MKANKTMRRQAVPNNWRRKDKESESNIDSAAHNQILTQQKQLNDRNHHIPININMELTSLSKDNIWQTVLKRKIQQSAVYRKPIISTETSTGLG